MPKTDKPTPTLMRGDDGSMMLWSDDDMAWAKRLGWKYHLHGMYIYFGCGGRFTFYTPEPKRLTYVRS